MKRRLSQILLATLTVTLYYLVTLIGGYPKIDPHMFVALVALVYLINKGEMTN